MDEKQRLMRQDRQLAALTEGVKSVAESMKKLVVTLEETNRRLANAFGETHNHVTVNTTEEKPIENIEWPERHADVPPKS